MRPLAAATTYTVLLAVRSGTALSPTVLALHSILVPDLTPPSFTTIKQQRSVLLDAPDGSIELQLELGLSEPGAVRYALYQDAPCTALANLTGSGNLTTAACTCASAAWCAPAAEGMLQFPAAGVQSFRLRAQLPPSPFERLRGLAASQQLFCNPEARVS